MIVDVDIGLSYLFRGHIDVVIFVVFFFDGGLVFGVFDFIIWIWDI